MTLRGRLSLGLRLRVWWRRHALTEALAGGADPDDSAELTVVARELIGARSRRKLAAAIDRVLRAASERSLPRSPAVPINRRQVADPRDELANLAVRLRATGAVPAHAVARAELLLSDAKSPLYYHAPRTSAWDLARAARLALDDPIV
jgi:hypothetical protein